MKLYNAEIALLLPVVRREAKQNPNREWDRLLERIEKIAKIRAAQYRTGVMPGVELIEAGKETTPTRRDHPSRDHPLL